MLPKKRKFDLSKFELDRDEGRVVSGGDNAVSAPVVTTVQTLVPGLPHPSSALLTPLPNTSRHSSSFLPPETVHDAFAGSYRQHESRGDSVVDLSRKPGSSVTIAQFSAFSRPSPAAAAAVSHSPQRFRSSNFTDPAQSFKQQQSTTSATAAQQHGNNSHPGLESSSSSSKHKSSSISSTVSSLTR